MRFLCVLIAACAVTAQSPLTTTFANDNGGSVGGAIYFDLECLDPAGVSIFSIDLNFGGTGGSAGSIDVYYKDGGLQPHTSADWVGPICTGNVGSSMPAGTPTTVGLAPTLQLGFGCKVGVAIVANGLAHAYSNGALLPSSYSTSELNLTVGGASNVPFVGALFTPRVANISIPYSAGGNCPDIATVYPDGSGCGGHAVFASFYELVSAAGFDLSGMKVTGTNNGSGYDITVAAGSGVSVPVGATMVPLTDDSQAAVGSLGMSVGSNCWLALGAGNSDGFSPSAATFLSNPSTGVYSWTDLNPGAAGSGQVFYDEVGTLGRATYDGVFGFGVTDPNFVQISYDTANGNFTIEWGVTATTNPQNWLVGYSPGGANADPSSTDISASAPFSIAGADDVLLDLVLTPVTRPIQGFSPAPFQVTTENIPASALAQIGIFGLTNPAQPLDSLGLPGCFLNASLDVLSLEVLPPNTPSFTWTAVTLPSIGPFRRVYHFNLQSVILGTNLNTFLGVGGLTSNGLKCRTGKL